MRRRWAVALAFGTLCAPAIATAALIASSVTGNPQGIKLAKRVMRAYAHISVYKQTEQHFFQIRTDVKLHSFHYLFGKVHKPGYVWASEKATVAIHHNRVMWWMDVLRPARSYYTPVEIVLNRRGRYWAFGTPSHHSCFRTFAKDSTLPHRYGGPGYSIGGRMGAPQKGPTTDVLPYDYGWGSHRTAHETDTIERATKLVRSGDVNITGHRAVVLMFGFADTFPKRAPEAPAATLCGR